MSSDRIVRLCAVSQDGDWVHAAGVARRLQVRRELLKLLSRHLRDDMREQDDTLGTQLDSLLKGRPMTAMLGAVGVGHVPARLMHR